jgi:hypothetical protein
MPADGLLLPKDALLQNTMSTKSGPRDGPATTFQADPLANELVAWKTNGDACKPDTFGLVLVVGWPPNLGEVKAPHESLLRCIRKCFDSEDLEGSNAPVYLYGPECLHVTIATLHSVLIGTKDPREREKISKYWRKTVVSASRRPEWPKSPLKLTIKSSQIGSAAGILLWNELTGGAEAMRKCVADEVTDNRSELQAVGICVDTLQIPNILHTTFLRFNRVPATKGETVQARFREYVLPKLEGMFSYPITFRDARLVCEKVPYMHIPDDSDHVLETFHLC